MNNYLLDTNIFSIFFSRNPNLELIKSIENTLSDSNIFISGITYYEVKRGLLAINALNEIELFNNLCKNCNVLWLDDKRIFDEASMIYSDLRKSGVTISDADIFIASIARIHHLILVSEDVGFQKIQNIKVVKLKDWLR